MSEPKICDVDYSAGRQLPNDPISVALRANATQCIIEDSIWESSIVINVDRAMVYMLGRDDNEGRLELWARANEPLVAMMGRCKYTPITPHVRREIADVIVRELQAMRDERVNS